MNELFRQAEQLQDLLIASATSTGADNEEYKRLRLAMLSNARLESAVPVFIRSCRDLSQFWQFIKPKFRHYAGRRQFIWNEFRPLLDVLEGASGSPADDPVSTALDAYDEEHVNAAWRKALDRRDADPEGAITAARALLESVCKHILDDMGEVYGDAADFNKLYRQTAEALHIAPTQHTEQVFKQILGGCTAVVEGLAALRNRVSDSHGKGKKAIRPSARHAELSVNLAGAVATFLLATHSQRPVVGRSVDSRSDGAE